LIAPVSPNIIPWWIRKKSVEKNVREFLLKEDPYFNDRSKKEQKELIAKAVKIERYSLFGLAGFISSEKLKQIESECERLRPGFKQLSPEEQKKVIMEVKGWTEEEYKQNFELPPIFIMN